eukprot:m.97248 g.97248  ORF g.97248 m.97248 type:complete len:142 (+) comp15520_c0_seq1:78-503(+)
MPVLPVQRNAGKKENAERSELLITGDASKQRSKSSSSSSSNERAKSFAVTERLRATGQLLSAQLEEGGAALTVLTESSRVVKDTAREMGKTSESVRTGHKSLDSMKRKEKLDKLFIYGGMAFFFLTVLYIIFIRTIGRFIL